MSRQKAPYFHEHGDVYVVDLEPERAEALRRIVDSRVMPCVRRQLELTDSLRDIVLCVYLQGLTDGAEVRSRRPL